MRRERTAVEARAAEGSSLFNLWKPVPAGYRQGWGETGMGCAY